PTTAEKEVGFESFFNTTTIDILNSIQILENVALVDLKDIRKIIPNANSSCGSAQFLAQIEKTLKEFPNIYQVYMAINKDPNKIYEWLQLGCTEMNFYCDEKPFTFKSEIDGANIEIPIVANPTTNTQEEIMDIKTE
ncbi:MAG: hypothetical protein Q7J14_00695, partial [Candidatus Magasanikbacteria bacterium]|nr:hypothetical protein [Candidatus Magasanikbacteria bacterium]